MLATSLTAALFGIDAHLVRVEADTAMGFPSFTMVGLPDSAVKESEGRIRAALRNCGYDFKWDRRIIVNLAPASLRKVGSSFDLATAIGLLAADGTMPKTQLAAVLLVGELALDGSVRPVHGLLPMMLMARRQGIKTAIVPAQNAHEASIVSGVRVFPVQSLPDAVELAVSPDRPAPPLPPAGASDMHGGPVLDMADVRGQLLARRSLEIAAAGGHNLLMVGPPGSGKTMLARRLPGILPPLSDEEALETTAIHSAWGIALDRLITTRPFRHPHHTASDAALVGGGGIPRPGEVSLAHNGVLFLDEIGEFRRSTLEALRQPLEDRFVQLARVRASIRLPARFQLVAAMNPCPCGNRGNRRHSCDCSERRVSAYRGRLSAPLLDRIDLHVDVAGLSYTEISAPPGDSSASVATRVMAARARQRERWRALGLSETTLTNSELCDAALRAATRLDGAGAALLSSAMERLGLSARAHDRILRVSRTLADLEGTEHVLAQHIAEALQFRPSPRP